MKKIKILRKGLFEKVEAFEDRISNLHGYEAVSISNDGASIIVMMKRTSLNYGQKESICFTDRRKDVCRPREVGGRRV